MSDDGERPTPGSSAMPQRTAIRSRCDEMQPSCGRCKRLHKQCVYDRPPNIRALNQRRKIVQSSEQQPSEGSQQNALPGVVGDEQTGALAISQLLELSTPWPETNEIQASQSASMAGWGMDSFLEGFLSEASFTFDPDVSAPPPQEPAVMADFPNLTFDAIPAPETAAARLPGSASDTVVSNPGALVLPDSQNDNAVIPAQPIHDGRDAPEQYLARLPPPRPPPISYPLQRSHYQLLHHFFNVTTSISVACDTEANPLRNYLFSLVTGPSDPAPESNPAFHALLAFSAFSLASLHGDILGEQHGSEFGIMGGKLVVRALRQLAVILEHPVDGRSVEQHRRMVCGTTALILLAAVTSGDTRFVSLVKDSSLTYFRQLIAKFGSDVAQTTSSIETRLSLMFLSAYETLSGFTGHEATKVEGLPSLTDSVPGVEGVNSIWGISRQCWGHLVRALDLLRRSDRATKDGDFIASLEIWADATDLEAELASGGEEDIDSRLRAEANSRVSTGSKLLLIGMRVLLLREIFLVPPQDERVQVLMDVWQDPNGRKSWREAVLVRGRPIFV
ncbi:hypothetical protein JCM24511_07362 [Saitozyma sp. JCM 24511]|nr:hypothetical protein JCM24511_07362 [Saitozyma sp. JCM 24511]